MKKILILALIMLITTACSATPSNQENKEKGLAFNYTDGIDKESVEQAGVDGDFAYDISNPAELKNNATDIFVATVNSVDSATCNLAGYEYSPIPYTLGKLEIVKSYVGNAKGTIDFSRMGGTVTMAEYDRNAPTSAVEKRKQLQASSGKAEAQYMHVAFNGDIELLAGKTYLFYARFNETYNRYEILGYEYGSRIIEGFNAKARTANNEATILNNKTGEKENFDAYVQNYLK
ncbi:MAG: hypothetical protein RR646_02120 [Erysipelotrichaceae bacterium]